MFKIDCPTIHCSRGDAGAFTIKIPIIDVNKYIKYKDAAGSIYWYDNKRKILYDSNYEETNIELDTLTMECYQFQEGDKITFNIYEKNGYNKSPLMTKNVFVNEAGESVNISLSEEDTTFGSPINKPTIFWYDVTLNDNLTVICYDEDGAKEFIEYPAKGDEE